MVSDRFFSSTDKAAIIAVMQLPPATCEHKILETEKNIMPLNKRIKNAGQFLVPVSVTWGGGGGGVTIPTCK